MQVYNKGGECTRKVGMVIAQKQEICRDYEHRNP